jgi:hypothetical protein
VKPYRDNPWGLTKAQFQSLAAVIEHGSQKGAARALNLQLGTVNQHINAARVRMCDRGAGRVNHLIVFDRWHRVQPAVEPVAPQ